VTPEQVDLVESSVAALGARLDDVVDAFYARLFAIAPETRSLFGGDPARQRAKFASELAFLATVIRQHDRFVTTADDMGRRHGAVGVRPEHFRPAGEALLEAIAETLGPAWTPEVEVAWRLAYRLTAEAMMAGTARPSHH
jgi:nitric oxide dioxygenase